MRHETNDGLNLVGNSQQTLFWLCESEVVRCVRWALPAVAICGCPGHTDCKVITLLPRLVKVSIVARNLRYPVRR